MAINLTEQNDLVQQPGYQGRVAQVAVTAAIAISNEGAGVGNHAARAALADMVTVRWQMAKEAFIRAVATQLASVTPTDDELNLAVSGIWNTVARAMNPGLWVEE